MTHFTDRQEKIVITCQDKVFLRTIHLDAFLPVLKTPYCDKSLVIIKCALITLQLLFSFKQGPPLVLFDPPPRLVWAIAPHHLCGIFLFFVRRRGEDGPFFH